MPIPFLLRGKEIVEDLVRPVLGQPHTEIAHTHFGETMIIGTCFNFLRTRYYPTFKLTTWHPQWVLDHALAEKVIEFIEWEEYIQEARFDRYTDFSGIAEIRIDVDSIIEIARRRRIAREPVKSALFGNDQARLEVAQSYERLMRDATMIQVSSFSNRKAAAAWFEVPETILEPAVAGGR